MSRNTLILDLGYGNGRIAINLAKLGYKIVGVDISPLFIEDVRKKAREYNVEDKVEFIVCNALDLDKALKDYKFNAVILYWSTVIGYYASGEVDKRILKNIRKVTRDSGYLFILNTASLDLTILRASVAPFEGIMEDIDEELVLVEKA